MRRTPTVGALLVHYQISLAVIRYDESGGLANDTSARHDAINHLAQALGIDYEPAAELLADALARRATNKMEISK